MMLSRDAILSAQDLKTEDVAVPEWGGSVRVRTMTGTERDAFLAELKRDEAGKVVASDYGTRLIAFAAVGDDGARLFADADVAALGAKSGVALQRAFTAADRLNSTSEAAVQGAEKNSPPDPSAASS